MIKHLLWGLILLGLILMVVGALLIFFSSTSQADGDRIEPSVPFGQEMSVRGVDSCNISCYSRFDKRIEFYVRNTPPPDRYDSLNSRLWMCLQGCDQ